MPSRILRDGILTSDRINSLSLEGEMFYRRLISVVDDYGRFEAHPAILRPAVYPRRLDQVTEQSIERYLDECSSGDDPLITVYIVGRKRYLQINNFNQRLRSGSKYPDPPTPLCGQNDGDTADTSLPMRARDDGHADAHARGRSESETETYAEAKAEDAARAFSATASVLQFPRSNGHQAKPSTDLDPSFELWAEDAYMAHPKKVDKFLALNALKDRFGRDPEARKIFSRNHPLWCATDDWQEKNGRFAPKLHEYIGNDGWLHPPNRSVANGKPPSSEPPPKYSPVPPEARNYGLKTK